MRGGLFEDTIPSSLNGSPKIAAFSVVYDIVQRMDENGSSDLVLFQNSLAEFETGYEHPFTMEACWRILKNHAAWTEIEMPLFNQRHGYLTEKEQQQLLLDEEALRETLEEEARDEKELKERIKQEQAHDELFRLEFRVKSDSEYESD
ncbi:hypothetical protein Tco_0590041 [Tanacetum coccineum]